MKSLFCFLIISLSINSFGQNLIPNYQIGSYIDYNKKIINGYYDFDYEPKISLKVSYEASQNFAQGYYFDENGRKVNGLLKYSQNDRDLKFKLREDDIEKSIQADETKGYIIGIDTFSVVKNVEIIGLFGAKISKKGEFAANIENIGGMKFYKFTANGPNGNTYNSYIVKKSESSDFVTFPSGSNKFKSLATEIFGDDAILKEYIDQGKYIEGKIPSMLKIYKYRKLFYRGQHIYYNSSRDETNNQNESEYYSKIESVHDSVFHLITFFKNNVKISEGDFTSFYPHNKQGDFMFYYPNGEVRKKISFKNNKPKAGIEYFENGKIHRVYEILEYGSLVYREVYDDANVNLLDNKWTGSEQFTDPVSGKKITYEYENKKLKTAYFIDSNGEKMYQLCENNAEIRKFNSLQKSAKEDLRYPLESLHNNVHGFVLVKCIVEPTGLVSEIKIIKGLDEAVDKETLDFLSFFKTEAYWKPAKVDGKEVKQEIIFPIDFSIITTSIYRNNYYNFWFLNNMMMQQQQMMMQQNTIRVGGFR
ncbi:energy transducer TonB [Flavobacterium cellulosilyticum]|uniref:TonB family protein n=1 Tax=Flavobacterium cellulosilyticum TaxID=2541731 RepID=A0A4R5CDA5_9FLAO|nr:energy transducer TonB [Flavobacterium cellulosilyticum]TDD97465.1 TonB family protein [Flavobacterium cellulosilyticum]